MSEMQASEEVKSPRFLETFNSTAQDFYEEPEMEWIGFGTEEDDRFLSNISFFSPTGAFVLNESFSHNIDPNSLDYQVMHEDDDLFDSFLPDMGLFSSLPPLSSSTLSSCPDEKKTWSSIVGRSTTSTSSHSFQERREEEEGELKEVCRYWRGGSCIYGDSCWYAHEETTQISRGNHTLENICSTCCICQDDIVKEQKRFGLMQNCDHLFCLECIRNWRYSNLGDPNVRRCPLCRSTSFYVIPSNEPIFDVDVKNLIVNAYQGNMSSEISCRYFQGGNGVCPFGESCFYSHTLENGQSFTSRMVMKADGELKDIGYSRCLGDFFVQKTKQQKKQKKQKKKGFEGNL